MADLPIMAITGMAVFAAASAFFAVAESALFSLGKWRAQEMAERSPALGNQVVRLLNEPQDLLATIVLGNTFANAGLVGTALWLGLEGSWQIGWTIAGALLVILVPCEVIPKTLAVRDPEAWALRLVKPVAFLLTVSKPLRRVALSMNTLILRAIVPESVKPRSAMTEAEYQELIEMAYQQGALRKAEKEIILQIISLDQRTAKDVMKPRAQMACISDDLSIEDMIAAARKFKHRRLPLFDETPDTIVGILNTRTLLLDPHIDLAEAIELPSFVPETMNLLQLFKSLQRQQRGLAIVLDEFGGTAGLVTMEDILEEVVGELHGEGEAQGFIMEKLGEGRWRVHGTMRVDDFRREFPALEELPEVDTMGGLLTALLGVVPAQGETALFSGLRLTAQAADERRVRELLVEATKKA
ncbi:MAG: HlyC/CorC family transporter [Verrucomicrobia bacterium]|nr:HlyC/CorC family transporter [Verrucomicrobiota bacterium]